MAASTAVPLQVAEQRKLMWVPDEDAPVCALCQTEFTLLNRRHHCRRCLKVFCNACSSKRERLVLFGHAAERVRVCNLCYPVAQRENEFEEVHLRLLMDGGVFHRHRKVGSTVPIFMGLSANKKEIEWRSVELVNNRPQSVERIPVSTITTVIEVPQSNFAFEVVTGQTSIKLDAGSTEHRSQWITALREATQMLLKNPREEIDNALVQDHHKAQADAHKAERKQKRLSQISTFREKYGAKDFTANPASPNS